MLCFVICLRSNTLILLRVELRHPDETIVVISRFCLNFQSNNRQSLSYTPPPLHIHTQSKTKTKTKNKSKTANCFTPKICSACTFRLGVGKQCRCIQKPSPCCCIRLVSGFSEILVGSEAFKAQLRVCVSRILLAEGVDRGRPPQRQAPLKIMTC